MDISPSRSSFVSGSSSLLSFGELLLHLSGLCGWGSFYSMDDCNFQGRVVVINWFRDWHVMSPSQNPEKLSFTGISMLVQQVWSILPCGKNISENEMHKRKRRQKIEIVWGQSLNNWIKLMLKFRIFLDSQLHEQMNPPTHTHMYTHTSIFFFCISQFHLDFHHLKTKEPSTNK